MLNVIKQELEIEEALKNKIEFICSFVHITPIIQNGSIRKIDKTNLIYVEPHRITIKNNTLLAFNYENNIYIENLSKSIPLKELEKFIKTL